MNPEAKAGDLIIVPNRRIAYWLTHQLLHCVIYFLLGVMCSRWILELWGMCR